jgi:flagellin
MSLGVLNNLNAMYAENNLNNTSNSLSKTLQQLSSGSRINSGADDAAGLSLVNGLAANATALTQSQTNATEGVGLLQVADGALSQVTSLLNRAVTLATEASNGTLNSSQLSAANQEYQSILSEVNNIGSTTTYNQEKVFGSSFNIYTGDSSSQGASINTLSIGTLASSDVGQTNGAMNYNAGQGVFLDLSLSASGSTTTAATTADTITAGQTLTFTNASGQTTTITSPTGGETVSSLVNAINTSGLGITATFTTAKAANDATAGAQTDTGILISGAVKYASGSPTSTGLNLQSTVMDNNTSATGGNLSSGIATISYTAQVGVDLSQSDLTTQADAESTLTSLNAAITDVAGQDGYIGAQINTLNSVSSVMNTQQQNVTSAQNAVQATDYAQASSNLSKFEILSQTGISALAQANSLQQEVTKLLQ